MRASLFLAAAGLTSAASLPNRQAKLAPALPLSAFATTDFVPLTLPEILAGVNVPNFKVGADSAALAAEAPVVAAALGPQCTNPRIRTEWDNYSTADRTSFTNAVNCLIGKPPSGQFPAAKNRHEDLVMLHQLLTPNIHTNGKFLLWHRYFLWAFEDILRTECGFTANLPWFDETKYSGRFSQSTVFSSQWFGGIALGGNCVTDGKFAGLTLNIGPGSSNVVHCLARNGNGALTQNTNSSFVNACNARTDYASMNSCSFGGPHANGHNGIGAVMSDMYASPGDPVFWLHHGFIDHNYRIWQNANPTRIETINGVDVNGVPLTLTTSISLNGVRPNVQIQDILDTLGEKLCYRYDY